MYRLQILFQLLWKKENLFWTLFFGILTVAAWFWPNISIQDKTYCIFAISIFIIIFLLLRILWELLGENVSYKTVLDNIEANRSVPLISLSNELSNNVRVLSTYEHSGELRLIVSESPNLTTGTVVTLFHKDTKGSIEQYFGLGVVRFIQTDGKVQIAIVQINFEPEQSRERLIKKDVKLLKNIKLSTIIFIEFLKDWSATP